MLQRLMCFALGLAGCQGVGDVPEARPVATRGDSLRMRVPDLFITVDEAEPGAATIQHKVNGGVSQWTGGAALLRVRYQFLPGYLSSRTTHLDLGGTAPSEYQAQIGEVDLKALLRSQYTGINRYCDSVLKNDPNLPPQKLVSYSTTIPFELNSVNGDEVASTSAAHYASINCIR